MSRECCGGEELTTLGPSAAARLDDGCCGEGTHAHDEPPEAFVPWWRDRVLVLPTVSGVLLAIGHGLAWSGASLVSTSVLAASLAAGAWTFVPGALRRLARGRLGVGLLMTIAAAGAIALGHVGEAAALAFLFSIAEALEDRAMDKARHGLRALLSLIPETARVSRLSGEVVIPSPQIRTLDILVVGAGERIATDGVVWLAAPTWTPRR